MILRILVLLNILSSIVGYAQPTSSKIEAFNWLKDKLEDNGIREPVYWKRSVDFNISKCVLTLTTNFTIIYNKTDTEATHLSIFTIPMTSVNPDNLASAISTKSMFGDRYMAVTIHTKNNDDVILAKRGMNFVNDENLYETNESEYEVEISPEKIEMNKLITDDIIKGLKNLVLLCGNEK